MNKEEIIDLNSIEEIDNLLKFLPIFKDKNFNPINEELLKSGKPYMLCYSKEVDDFIRAFYKNNFLVRFKWMDWKDEASKYYENPLLLDNANLETIRKLLTFHIRQERFFDGYIIDMIENGHIVMILERLLKIKDTL